MEQDPQPLPSHVEPSQVEYRKWLPLLPTLVARPRLWRSAARFVPPRWYAHWPPLPLPPKPYIGFRMETAYGDRSAVPSKTDLVDFLDWCNDFHKMVVRRTTETQLRPPEITDEA